MLTYSIAPHQPPPRKQGNAADFLQRSHILSRQLEKNRVKMGEVYWASTPKGRKQGKVIGFITDPKECKWKSGTQPYFIRMAFPCVSIVDGNPLPWGVEIFELPIKKVRA